MKSYVYIIQTIFDTFYCGYCVDIVKRYNEHCDKNSKKGAKYTKSHPPKKIVYLKEFSSKIDAMKEEYRIKKTLSHAQKTDLIKENKSRTEKLLEKCGLFFD